MGEVVSQSSVWLYYTHDKGHFSIQLLTIYVFSLKLSFILLIRFLVDPFIFLVFNSLEVYFL